VSLDHRLRLFDKIKSKNSEPLSQNLVSLSGLASRTREATRCHEMPRESHDDLDQVEGNRLAIQPPFVGNSCEVQMLLILTSSPYRDTRHQTCPTARSVLICIVPMYQMAPLMKNRYSAYVTIRPGKSISWTA